MTWYMIFDYLGRLFWSGWTSLLDYLAAHVLLCLIPAFVIAGYMSAMIPKEVIIRYLGPTATKRISYPASAMAGFLLAVCSCTILPLFAGIWKRGAGLGPAITFLFVGPAVNILAIAYTGAAIGMDIAIARILLSIVFGIGIGLIMAWLFRQEESRRMATLAASGLFQQTVKVKKAIWVLFGLLMALLLTGTLQIPLLTGAWLNVRLPLTVPPNWLTALQQVNLTPQGLLIILLLLLTAPVAAKGFTNVLEKSNRWTSLALGLVAFTLLAAAPTVTSGSLVIGITGRFVSELVLIVAIGWLATRHLEAEELAGWLWETWKFVRQIFPLLIIGVFAAGVVKELLPETWIRSLAGRNTIWANLAGVLFGVVMYFPTLVEVPIARMLLDLGMHRGPLLAYLLADPELSLQSILVTGKILGREKTLTYVILVTIFSTLAGYLFGWLLAIL